jgi:hypothetical protein
MIVRPACEASKHNLIRFVAIEQFVELLGGCARTPALLATAPTRIRAHSLDELGGLLSGQNFVCIRVYVKYETELVFTTAQTTLKQTATKVAEVDAARVVEVEGDKRALGETLWQSTEVRKDRAKFRVLELPALAACTSVRALQKGYIGAVPPLLALWFCQRPWVTPLSSIASTSAPGTSARVAHDCLLTI